MTIYFHCGVRMGMASRLHIPRAEIFRLLFFFQSMPVAVTRTYMRSLGRKSSRTPISTSIPRFTIFPMRWMHPTCWNLNPIKYLYYTISFYQPHLLFNSAPRMQSRSALLRVGEVEPNIGPGSRSCPIDSPRILNQIFKKLQSFLQLWMWVRADRL